MISLVWENRSDNNTPWGTVMYCGPPNYFLLWDNLVWTSSNSFQSKWYFTMQPFLTSLLFAWNSSLPHPKENLKVKQTLTRVKICIQLISLLNIKSLKDLSTWRHQRNKWNTSYASALRGFSQIVLKHRFEYNLNTKRISSDVGRVSE